MATRKRVARFTVRGRIGPAKTSTLEIDEANGLATVRPYRSRSTYTLPLERVCRMIALSVATAELKPKPRRKVARGLLSVGR